MAYAYRGPCTRIPKQSTLVFEADFQCPFNIGSGTCPITVRGPQALTGVHRSTRSNQTLRADIRTVSSIADNPSFLCRSATVGNWGGDFRITTGRLTIS
jgi:hypothetical protein